MVRPLGTLAALIWTVVATAATQPPLGGLPVVFEPNRGQAQPEVLFVGRGAGFVALFARLETRIGLGSSWVSLKALDAAEQPAVEGLMRLSGHSNYFWGPDPERWLRGVPHYQRLCYRGLYPGIDLFFYGHERRLVFDLLVAPGADPSRIRFQVRHARRLSLDAEGTLVVEAGPMEIRFPKPFIYQPISGEKRIVSGGFTLLGEDAFGFAVGDYDRRQPLVIDPTLLTSYLGGRDTDIVAAAASDGSGNLYLTGYTASSDFPLSATPYKSSLQPGDADAFVVKLNATATTILYATYLGGPFADYGRAIAVDFTGAAYITGSTVGRFPVTTGAYRQLPADAPTIFVAKLDANGGSLAYATYLDGAGAGHAIAVDSAGNAYVAGYTYSASFLTSSNAVQRTYGGATDAFVVKVNATGSALAYSTFIGGSSEDQATAIAVNSSGEAFVAGFTSSSAFPVTTGAFRTSYGGSTDAFALKLDATASSLLYSTYLGGPNIDRAWALDIDAAGNAYIAGQTYSSSFPTTAGAVQTTHGGGTDAFLSKLNSSGSALIYSTFLGGSGTCLVQDPFRQYQCDAAYAVRVNASGQAYVAGLAGAGFPLAGATQPSAGGAGDAFVSHLTADGSRLLHSAYIGGAAGDVALALALPSGADPVVAGLTASTDLPVGTGVLQPVRGGGTLEGFLTRLAPCTVTLPSSGSFFPGTGASYALDVFAASSCGWSAESNASWITITSGAGAGNGQVQYTVATNNGPLRSGQIIVNGASYTVQQVSNSCVTLGSYSSWFPQSGGTYSLPVFATCSWSATSNVSWITINSGTGSGDGAVDYTVAANNTGAVRFGQIDVSGQIFQVSQLGGPAGLACSYTLSKTSDAFGKGGGSGSLWVTAASGCEWTVSNSNPWIRITAGLAGSGSGIVGYTVAPNRTGQPRLGVVTLGGQTLTLFQAP